MTSRNKARARRPAERRRPRATITAPASALLRLSTFGNADILPALGLVAFRSVPDVPAQVYPPKPDSRRRRVQRPESNRNNRRLEPDLTPANSTRARFLTATKSSIAFPPSFVFSGAGDQSSAVRYGQFAAEVVNNSSQPLRAFKGTRVDSISASPHAPKQSSFSGFRLPLVFLLALQFVLLPALARAASPSNKSQDKEALGSLSSVGEVYVNDAPAPAESTIFSGDVLRTSDSGTATFATSGRGSFKITSRSQLVFTGSTQYTAELKSGTVVMSSLSGPAGINLRAGNYVVVAVTQGDQSTSRIDSGGDGSFLVTCVEGSVGVLPLDGPNGLFLQFGQSITITPQGELTEAKAKAPVPPPSTPPQPSTPGNVQKKSYTGWIILAAAGAGGVGAVAALAGHKGNAVSPATP